MNIERLKKAVEELETLIEEMQDECSQFREKKSDWYDFQLCRWHSGLKTKEQFNKEVFDKYQEIDTLFDDDLFSLQRGILNLETRYRKFDDVSKKLDKIVEDSDKNIPEGWKLWKVTFNDSDYASLDSRTVYGPNEEYAKNRILAIQKRDYNEINVTKVERVKKIVR